MCLCVYNLYFCAEILRTAHYIVVYVLLLSDISVIVSSYLYLFLWIHPFLQVTYCHTERSCFPLQLHSHCSAANIHSDQKTISSDLTLDS